MRALVRAALLVSPREFRVEYADQVWEDFAELTGPAAGLRMAANVAANGVALRLETLQRNLRHAARSLARAPVFTLVCGVTLALAISVNTTAFSVIDAVLLHPLPFADAARLTFIGADAQMGGTIIGPQIRAYQQENRTFASIATYEYLEPTLTGAGRARQIKTERVSWNLFGVARAIPQLGRFFTAADERSGHSIVLSDGMWRRLFGARLDALGKVVRIDGTAYHVVGVAKSDFAMPDHRTTFAFSPEIAAWICAPAADFSLQARYRRMYALGRLRDGVAVAAAQRDLSRIAARMAAAAPVLYKGVDVAVVPLEDFYLGQTRDFLLLTFAAVALILLIACANVANLLLVRSVARRHETGLRSALGALRGTLAAEYLSEVVLLTLTGGALGILFAVFEVRAVGALASGAIPRLSAARIDAGASAFVLLTIAGCMLAIGLVPAIRAGGRRLTHGLSGGGRSGAAAGRTARARMALAAVQIALAFVVLTTSSLLVHSWYVLMKTDVGFSVDGAYAGYMILGDRRYADRAAIRSFVDRAVGAVAALPEVTEAAAALNVPCTRGAVYSTEYHIAGRAPSPNPVVSSLNFVTARYFHTMGIRLVRGRVIDARDRAGSKPVVVISDVLARREFGDANPIGKQLVFDPPNSPYPVSTIVGVVGAVRGRLDGRLQGTIYVPFAQYPVGVFQIVIRSAGDPGVLARRVTDVVAPLDPLQAPPTVISLRASVNSWAATQRTNAVLFVLLALVALALAFAGIYGVVADSTVQRSQEFGIRMALGATRGAVLKGVLGEALRVGIIGAAAGVVLSALSVRGVAGLLFGISPFDPAAIAAATAALLVCAMVSAAIPARRATALNPVAALRYE